MNPLFITISFLMLMGVLTTSVVNNYIDSTMAATLYKSHCQTYALAQKEREKGLLHKFKVVAYKENDLAEKKPKPKEKKEKSNKVVKRSIDLNFNLCRPPDNSRFNLNLLLTKDDSRSEITRYEIGAALLRNLYSEKPFFNEIPQVEYHILDTLIAKKQEVRDPDLLPKLIFDDERVQNAFYQMLTETPSLLDYITFSEPNYHAYNKVNLMFAAPELVAAVFNHSAITEAILDYRQELWGRILEEEAHRKELDSKKCLNKTKIKDMFKQRVAEILSRENLAIEPYEKVCEFSLGKPGKMLFVTDPATGIALRQKL
ncbi:MAG: hypothetical protein KR126chlam2_00487 [Chlamydiae bacterium]|nr:hypothetical protein [Chlamydiota bacterium]